MTRISPSHPRYRSLQVRAALAADHRSGIVAPEGLIAHGRGEAFDYFLGERTLPSARRAEIVAAHWLRMARHPVVSVNGNVAALAASEIAALARALPGLSVEVNLFHRTEKRARAIAERLRDAGVDDVLGVRPTARLPGLDSDRARIDPRGIALADVCLIPLEDGDRAEALRRAGCRVIAIDLNPLSRTSAVADIPIVDELTRALRGITAELREWNGPGGTADFEAFDATSALRTAARAMAARLTATAAAPRPEKARRPSASPRLRGSGGRRRRARPPSPRP